LFDPRRMYDVGEDFDEPEQVLSFAGKWQKSSTYGLDVDHAASFCFGSKHSPWGQLAIYCLTQNGDVYMMCPIMPQNWYVPSIRPVSCDYPLPRTLSEKKKLTPSMCR